MKKFFLPAFVNKYNEINDHHQNCDADDDDIQSEKFYFFHTGLSLPLASE